MKLPKWRTAINSLVAEIKDKPLVFGEHDCALGWVFPAIQAQTGIDLSAPYRGKYSNFEAGARLVKADGFASLADLVASQFKEVHPAMAQVGDVVSMPCEHDGWALGVVLGESVGALTMEGYAIAPRSTALRAFRIE